MLIIVKLALFLLMTLLIPALKPKDLIIISFYSNRLADVRCGESAYDSQRDNIPR